MLNKKNDKKTSELIMKEVMKSFKALDEDLTDRLMEGVN